MAEVKPVVWYVRNSAGTLEAMPAPSSLEYGLMDVSAEDAGRALDANATMYKQRMCQKRKLNFAFQNIDSDTAAKILTAINPEYIDVRYFDALNNQWEVRNFYCGDRSAPMRWFWAEDKRYSEVSFNLIER